MPVVSNLSPMNASTFPNTNLKISPNTHEITISSHRYKSLSVLKQKTSTGFSPLYNGSVVV